MRDAVSNPGQNQNLLLEALSAADLKLLAPHLEPVSLKAGQIYAELSDPLKTCYFPNSGMVSLLSVTEAGDTCEIGYVGFEGMVGLPVIFGKNEMPYQALIQATSEGYRVPVKVVTELFEQNAAFRAISLRFAYVLYKQFAQTSACNRFHSIQSRLCRWFSIMCERSGDSHLSLTHEFLAYMLGAQRTTIGQIAGSLQRDGIIRYQRGRIEVIDVKRLEAHACECLPLINRELREFRLENKTIVMSTSRQTSGR